MLMGINLKKIDMVIFVRPYNHPSAVVQGGGRGGRKQTDGKRRRVIVYQLWNSQDLTSADKDMSSEMRNVCRNDGCTRKLMGEMFVGECQSSVDEFGCCHSCDCEPKAI